MNEYKCLERLLKRINNNNSFNIGAGIFDKKGTLLSYGYNNSFKTHPIMLRGKYKEYQKFVHAEIQCLENIHKIKSAYIMIIARKSKTNNTLIAKPCVGCYSLLKKYNFLKIYYTNYKGKLELLDTSISTDEYN